VFGHTAAASSRPIFHHHLLLIQYPSTQHGNSARNRNAKSLFAQNPARSPYLPGS